MLALALLDASVRASCACASELRCVVDECSVWRWGYKIYIEF